MAKEKIDVRAKIVEVFLSQFREKTFEKIDLKDIIEDSGFSVSEVRAQFGSTFDILAEYLKQLEIEFLKHASEIDDDLEQRDKLFELVLKRVEVFVADKLVMEQLQKSAMKNPVLLNALNRMNVRAHQWLLAAAKIECEGVSGAMKAQGLNLLFALVLDKALKDDSEDMSETMAYLDKQLDKFCKVNSGLERFNLI